MTKQEIKTIKMGAMLTWIPTGELFLVTGLNEIKVKDGTATKVTGLPCDEYGQYTSEAMPSLYSLDKVSI
tara:strand:+ start:254 stop:463 length:210 start_codon:yes stop_codon:yes gene_type:complete